MGGTWCLVKAMGAGAKGESGVQAGFYAVLGLGLKFPAAIYVLKVAKMPRGPEWGGAIAGVVLVYFVSVVAASIYGLRQNSTDQ